MTRFYPVFVRRSDAKLDVQTSKGKQKNAPTAAQLDRTPDAKGVCDYYREIAPDEVKHMDWRRKLAGMLLREIGGAEYADRASNSILHEFPENYRLYEHIKSRGTEGDGTTVRKPNKNHSGGGHDRQDAYLYGHPLGPKKRFRSPADYFPHLLWLTTDQAGDPNNCTCKLCCPEELEGDKAAAVKEPKAATPTAAIKKEETPSNSPGIGRHPIVEIIRRPLPKPTQNPPAQKPPAQTQIVQGQPSQNQTSKPATPVPTPIPTTIPTPTHQPSIPRTITPSPLPQPRSIDQQIDAQYSKFIFRSGELIWFDRGSAWGLGVITRRYIQKDSSQHDMRGYIIQPLSHPFGHPPAATITKETMLRPWLAWSAPPCTHSYLQTRPASYELVDWQGLCAHKYGSDGDLEVDGSILAAKSIDASYTLFDLVKTTLAPTGHEERHWNGAFLGGEKIWAGEPVRLRLGSGSDVMVVTDILERKPPTTGPGGGMPGGSRYGAFLVGDIYTFCSLDVPNPAAPPTAPSDRALPLRMREDLRWRNSVTLPTIRALGYWKLISVQARLDIAEIKGRWYESSILFPILQDPATFKQALSRGDISDAGTWMNARGDSSGAANVAGNRKSERVEALGRAVPLGTRIFDGIEPPPPPPQQVMGVGVGVGMGQDAVLGADGGLMQEGVLDDYLNLDDMDAGPVPGFGTTYGSQEGGHGFFG